MATTANGWQEFCTKICQIKGAENLEETERPLAEPLLDPKLSDSKVSYFPHAGTATYADGCGSVQAPSPTALWENLLGSVQTPSPYCPLGQPPRFHPYPA